MRILTLICSISVVLPGAPTSANETHSAKAEDTCTPTLPNTSRSAQPSCSEIVDAFVDQHMTSERIPGMAVAVLKAGQVVHAKGYGLADLEHQVPVTTQTVFQSGSVGKAFTVMAVMMLVDDGNIQLDDTLSKWFPDAPETWSAITVRHLLEHTSGLGGYPEDFDFRRDRTEAELYDIIKAQPLEFAPGERRGYSNLGFVLLGILINKATGKYYGDFLQQRIFAPLQMSTARIISEEDIVPNRASGYRLVDTAFANQEWVAPSLNTTADGALYLSLDDMTKWEAALNRGDLLSSRGYDQMWSPVTTTDGVQQPWAFSWLLENVNGRHLVGHSGGWQGFTANVTRFPAEQLAVIVFLNRRGANPVEPSRHILEIYAPELSIAGATVLDEAEPTVAEFVRSLVMRIADNKMSSDMFVDSVDNVFMLHSQEAADEFRSYGTLSGVELIAREELPRGTRKLQYRVNFETMQVVLLLELDAQNRIGSIDLRR